MTRSEPQILLLGASGLLGCTLERFLRARGRKLQISVKTTEGPRADFSDATIAQEILEASQPDLVINLIGLTDVDRCEREPHAAYLTNTRVVENVARWMTRVSGARHLVHISTDQVYDGTGLHNEENITLTNYYAFSKLAGELAAARVSSTILRTNFFGRSECPRRKSFTDWLYASLCGQTRIQVFDDVRFSPLSMETIAKVVDRIIDAKPCGTFNLGAREGMSKADFAYLFAEEAGLPQVFMSRSTSAAATHLRAYRPKDMCMNSVKIEEALQIELPTLRHEIQRSAEKYREES